MGKIGQIDDLEPLKFEEGDFMAQGESKLVANPFA